MIKKFFFIIIEPLKSFANRNFAEKLSVFYHKHKWISYLLAFLATIVLLVLNYVLPNL